MPGKHTIMSELTHGEPYAAQNSPEIMTITVNLVTFSTQFSSHCGTYRLLLFQAKISTCKNCFMKMFVDTILTLCK